MSISWRMALRIAAWALLVALAAITIGPISQRPASPLPASLERLIAWVCAGAAFATAYSGRCALMLLMLVSAGVFELAQTELLHRHSRLSDFFVKAIGGLVGVGSVRAIQYLRSTR
jgi:hypothetical protein